MNQQANVGSLDALREFRAAFCRFGEQGNNALGAIDMQIRRMLDWLQHDVVSYWQGEIQRREHQVNEARLDLMRARMAAMSDTPSCTEQEIAWRRAKVRLEEAEEKIRRIKHWVMVLLAEVEDFQGQSQGLRDHLEIDHPQGVALLDRMMDVLQSYLDVAAPAATPHLGSVSQGEPEPPPRKPPQEPQPHASR